MKAAGQRTGGPPRAPANADAGARIGMRHPDFNRAEPSFAEPGFDEPGFDEEKIARPDVVPRMGTRDPPQKCGKTLRVIILAPL